MKKFIILFLLMFGFIPKAFAEDSLSLNSTSAILIDSKSGKILYEKNADEARPMASMTKIMSMLLIMEQIDEGNLKYDDKVTISSNAASMGGSQVFLQAGEEYKVEALLRTIAVASANDAVVAMAEKIGGSVEAFVEMMNNKAQELGLQNTHFANPHGLDSENHYSSARDMAKMAQELLKYEDILKFTSIYEDYLTKPDGSQIWLVNTNRLVRFYEGVDGLKTGYTTDAGYCLTATAKKNNFRLISVVMNASSAEERSKDTTTLLTYGYNSFKNYLIHKKEDAIGEVSVLNGKVNKVKVYLEHDASDILSITKKAQNYSFNLQADSLKAGLKAGSVVGKAQVINNEGTIIEEINLIIKEDLIKANLFDYFKQNLKLITAGL